MNLKLLLQQEGLTVRHLALQLEVLSRQLRSKPGIQAEFSPPIEQLAFPIISEGESDLPGILDEPIPEVVQVLKESTDFQKVSDNLPQMDSDLKQWVHGLLSALDSQRG